MKHSDIETFMLMSDKSRFVIRYENLESVRLGAVYNYLSNVLRNHFIEILRDKGVVKKSRTRVSKDLQDIFRFWHLMTGPYGSDRINLKLGDVNERDRESLLYQVFLIFFVVLSKYEIDCEIYIQREFSPISTNNIVSNLIDDAFSKDETILYRSEINFLRYETEPIIKMVVPENVIDDLRNVIHD